MGRKSYHAAGCSAAVMHHGEMGELGDAEVAGDFYLGVVLGGEDHHAVYFSGVKPRVFAGLRAAFHGELHRGASGVFAELRCADAGDGCLTGEFGRHAVFLGLSVSRLGVAWLGVSV